MALATNSTPGSIVLAGDLTGTANTPELRVTGVTPGTYVAPDIVVDSKGRVLSATEAKPTFVGDMFGTRSATVLKASGVTAGSYTNASTVINSQGLVTSITSGGLTLSGMLTGAIGSNVLAPTGITAGTYNYVGITVDQTGRVTGVNTQPTGYPISSYSVNGIVQIDQNLGLTVSSGNLSGTMATNTVYGVIKTANSSNINNTTGAVDVGSNIPTLIVNNTFGKAVIGAIQPPYTTSFAPNVGQYDVFNVTANTNITIDTPIGAQDGDVFTILGNYTVSDTWYTADIAPPGTPMDVAWNGTVFCAVGLGGVWTSPGGSSWTAVTLPGKWKGIAWNGTVFCAVGDTGDNVTSRCATSLDGTSWTIRSLGMGGSFECIAWNGTIFYTSGSLNSTPIARTSTDGITWTGGVAAADYAGVAANGTMFCAVTPGVNQQPGQTYTSTDGISWTQGQDLPTGIQDLAWNGRVFLGVGYSGTSGNVNAAAAISYDGVTWGPPPHMPANNTYWHGITWAGNSFYAVGWLTNNAGSRAALASFAYGTGTFTAPYKFSNSVATPTYTCECTHLAGINYCTFKE